MSKVIKDRKYFDVRITGNGTRLQIIKSLQETVDKLKQTPEWLGDVEGRDDTLRVEIWRTFPGDAPSEFKPESKPKKGYTPTEDEIEQGFVDRELGLESD